MPHRPGALGAPWLTWCLALATVAACSVTDRRFTEPLTMPRLVAPASVSRVTRQSPTLRWVLGPGAGTPVVELCKDRACTMPMAVGTTMADDHLSAVPTAPLPLGWVYWRVRVSLGDQDTVTPTWQFWVGNRASGTPGDVDTSGGAIFDVNGDGYADLLVGAFAARHGDATGGLHIYLGSASPAPGDWNGASPARRIDVSVPSIVPEHANLSLSAAGDVNGDGFADFVVGTPFGGDGTGAIRGVAYLYLGSATPSADRWNGASPRDRVELVNPDESSAGFGRPAVALGDVNRDGYADFLVASSVFGGMQPAHVYLGSATLGADGWVGASPALRIDLSNPDGVNAFFLNAGSAGDVNGDGFADFVVATTVAGKNDGSVHVYLGSVTPDRATWNGDSPGARIDIASPDGASGRFFLVGSAGDVNGDGFADLMIGAASAASDLGVAHLYLGARDPASAWQASVPSSSRIDLTSPDATMTRFGEIVSSAGDVNGDGLADFVVSGFGTSFGLPNAGTAHLYLGMRMPSIAAWNGASPPQRIDVIAPEGPTSDFGDRPTLVGDINGDLHDDVVISSLNASAQLGAVYVYFGAVTPSALGWNGDAPARRITITGPDSAGSGFGTMR